MKAVKFKYQNIVFAEDQPEYEPLPALKIDNQTGDVVSCWRLSFKERLRVLFLGRVWLNLMTYNKPLTPSYMSVNRKDIFSHPNDDIVWWKKLLLKNK